MAMKSIEKPLLRTLDPQLFQSDPKKMKDTKKILIFALFLNLFYFLGVSFFVYRELSQNEIPKAIYAWLSSATDTIAHQLHGDEEKAQNKIRQLSLAKTPKELSAVAADDGSLVAILKAHDGTIEEIKGQRKDVPFPQTFFTKKTYGFHKNEKNFFITYFLPAPENPSAVYSLTYKKDLSTLEESLQNLGIQLSIVEKQNEEKKTLYSSLPSATEQDLFRASTQNESFFPLQTSPIDKMSPIQLVTLNKEKYLLLGFFFNDSAPLKQKMIYTLKLPEYATVSMGQVFVLIWTLFAIAIGALFIVFRINTKN